MNATERLIFHAAALFYMVGIAAGLLTSPEALAYLPHVASLAICWVAVPSMLRSRPAAVTTPEHQD